jgi:DNA-binding response OmpR family regulator
MDKATIFLLEDNVEISRMYERAFRLSGHEVFLASDGAKALSDLLAMKTPPEAVILDIMVPKLNGLEVLKKLRATDSFKGVPIIVLTNSFYKDDADRFLSAGADLYLIKSDNQIKDIIDKVESLVHSGRTILAAVPIKA